MTQAASAPATRRDAMPGLKGKNVLVTGGSSGIGQAIAVRFAEYGANVAINYLRAPEEAHDTEDQINVCVAKVRQEGVTDVLVGGDVSSEEEVVRMVGEAVDGLGGLDILVNNAGGFPYPVFPEAPLEHWSSSFDLNLRSTMVAIHFAVPAMDRTGGGAIVNIASSAGLGLAPHPAPEYAVAKAGIVRLTACLAPLAERGIRVNCVCPHTVGTPAVRERIAELQADGEELPGPLQDVLLEPEEVAGAVLDFITDETAAGRVLVLFGGQQPKLLPAE
jgi:glucose 1-dehydrogenase